MLPSDAPAAGVTPARRRVAIGAGAAAVLLASLDAYVVVTLFVDMAADMHVAVNKIQSATPIVTGFLLGYVAGMPLLGGLSDRMGRRLVTQLCLAGFLVGSVITAASIEIGEYLGYDPLLVLIAGRVLQGLAGGALLPVSMALVADLWSEHRRPAVLGTVGAAQELGSVLGPLYGATIGALLGWQGVFWINVPLVLLAMVGVHFAFPGRRVLAHAGPPPKVDVVGGLLLAVSLGLLTVGLYNETPEESILPSYGLQLVVAGTVAFVLFVVWETFARTKLVDLAGAPKVAFFAVLAASLLAGAALLVTLLDIVLFAQGVLDITDERESAKLLVHFLAALPVGALIGGVLARFGLRVVTVIGFLIAAFAYWLVSSWPATILSERHEIAGLSLPRMDTDLALAGLGLGLVIAPLSAAVLRIVPASQHGVASAAVVVARTIGMLIGFAAITGWGLHRFHQLTADLIPPEYPFLDPTPAKLDAYNQAFVVYRGQVTDALLVEYHEIFLITAACCLLAAVITLGITQRRREAEAPTEPATPASAEAPAAATPVA